MAMVANIVTANTDACVWMEDAEIVGGNVLLIVPKKIKI